MSMPEVKVIKDRINVDSYAHERNRQLLEKEERELQALLKGNTNEEEDDQEPNSESTENPQVSDEGSEEQKEVRVVESQEPEESDTGTDEGLTAEEKTFKKRYGDIRKLLQDKEKEWEEKYEKLSKQLDKAAKNELVLPKSAEEIEAWSRKYPDVAGIVEAIAESKANEKAASLDARLLEIEEMRTQAKREKAEAELYAMHPDFETIRKDNSFHDWVKTQPKVIQDALYDNAEDAKSVAVVLDRYKLEKGIETVKPKVSSDKAAASSIKSRKRAAVEADETNSYLTESAVAKMSLKEYEKRAEEILEAQKSGKFIYDLSR